MNYQFIQILEYLGIPNQVFLEIQREAVEEIEEKYLKEENKAIDSLLEKQNLNMSDDTALKMLSSGFKLDNFYLWKKLAAIVCSEIRTMQAKIKIPVKKSRNLLIIADPFGILEHNQVYVSVTSPEGRDIAIEGPVILSRNPCLLVTDVQLFEAVNKEQFKFYKNVCVMSSKGSCSPASLLSGNFFINLK